jgi:hypothetical protein
MHSKSKASLFSIERNNLIQDPEIGVVSARRVAVFLVDPLSFFRMMTLCDAQTWVVDRKELESASLDARTSIEQPLLLRLVEVASLHCDESACNVGVETQVRTGNLDKGGSIRCL